TPEEDPATRGPRRERDVGVRDAVLECVPRGPAVGRAIDARRSDGPTALRIRRMRGDRVERHGSPGARNLRVAGPPRRAVVRGHVDPVAENLAQMLARRNPHGARVVTADADTAD